MDRTYEARSQCRCGDIAADHLYSQRCASKGCDCTAFRYLGYPREPARDATSEHLRNELIPFRPLVK